MQGITKRFGQVVANDNVSLEIRRGEILALLGENGSGKTTLMNMLAGIYLPDEGEILADGKPISIRSPKDAFDHKIGMIHQHYKLVDVFTAAENIVLGLDEGGSLDIKATNAKVKEICDRYGFDIDPTQKIYDMSVSQKQTVEIVKVLYRGADILILDEPTAVLTPQETEKLFTVLRNMKKDGKAIVIITHKLNEVMELSDKVAVLRKGKYIGTVNTCDTNPQALTDMMVGHSVTLNIDRPKYDNPVERLVLKEVTCIDGEGVKKLDNVSFTAMGGEILGIAGIAGSGQKELLEAVAGLYPVAHGSIVHLPEGGSASELVGKTPMQIKKAGVSLAFVPEDRLGMGLVGSMGMTGNMMLRSWKKGKGVFVNRKDPNALAMQVWKELEVVTPGTEYPVRRLSGGNVQKVVVGREFDYEPDLLIMNQPTRGIDVGAIEFIRKKIVDMRSRKKAILLVSADLSEILSLSDTILVMHEGRIVGHISDVKNTSENELGLYMLGVKEDSKEQIGGAYCE